MRILQVGSNSIHFTGFLNQFDREEEISIVSEEEIDGLEYFDQYRVNFRSLSFKSIQLNQRLLQKIITEVNPDVIHIHQVNRLAYFTSRVAKKLNIPIVTTAWGSDVLVIPKKNRFNRFLVKKVLVRSIIVTADSQEMIEAMNEIAPKKEYKLLQYGIDPVVPSPKEKIIYSNRLHKDFYRIDQVIEYFSEFVKENSDWKLVIGADGNETPELKRKVTKLNLDDKVEFVGWLNTEENRKWYSKSTIYVSIPSTDGTAVSLLEAMSAGCIPVVSNLKVSYEWIKNGENGIIENMLQNPFTAALNINSESCLNINSKLINSRATRKVSMKKFRELYNLALK